MKIVEEYTLTKEEGGVKLQYFYRLIQTKYNNFPAYGIEIERKDFKGMSKIKEEKDNIELISSQRHKVKQVIMNLYKNEVSPIHLIDVLGEFVDAQAYEFDMGLIKEA